MESTFSWLDYSEHDRKRMIDVISSMREKDTRDELGIGAIRDSFADLLFPGTGTAQTRARYFLFTPWMYRYFESKKISSSKVEKRRRSFETYLIDALDENADHKGNIGRESREDLQRPASHIYWLGLNRWGILLFSGSQSQYHRHLDNWYRSAQEAGSGDDPDVEAQGERPNWDPHLPPEPRDVGAT